MSCLAAPAPQHSEQEEVEEDYMTARTSYRDSMDTSLRFGPETPSSSSRDLSELGKQSTDKTDGEEIEQMASIDSSEKTAHDTPKLSNFPLPTASILLKQPDSPTLDKTSIPHNSMPLTQTPSTARPSINGTATHLSGQQLGSGVRRRRSTGKAKTLGDTDSEGELEPGTVTIIR